MLRVREIMTPSVEVIGPTVTPADAARNMKNLEIGAIPVFAKERTSWEWSQIAIWCCE